MDVRGVFFWLLMTFLGCFWFLGACGFGLRLVYLGISTIRYGRENARQAERHQALTAPDGWLPINRRWRVYATSALLLCLGSLLVALGSFIVLEFVLPIFRRPEYG